MLSALQHYVFCPRQCALIHLEQLWDENGHTAEGRLMHESAHSGEARMRDGVRIVTDLELRSERLGLYGRADVVEFRRLDDVWVPYPVEYKKGRPHRDCDADEIQLCGQMLCLEEMLGLSLSEGALYYGETHHRKIVSFTPELRKRTETVAQAVHELFRLGETPLPEHKANCGACSLNEFCLPGLSGLDAASYVRELCGERL